MPIPVIAEPTDAESSLGPDKQDLEEVPDKVHFLYAKQWNELKKYTKWAWTSLQQLDLSGAGGTLNAAYMNYAAGFRNPCRVQISSTQGRILVTDYNAPGLNSILFGFSASDGSGEWGAWTKGLQLPNNTDALFSVGAPIRARSGIAGGDALPGYRLDTVNAMGVGQASLELADAGVRVWSVFSTGTLLAFDKAAPTQILWSLFPDTGASQGLRLVSSYSNFRRLLPNGPGLGSVGASGDQWGAIFSYLYSTRRQTVTWAANLALTVASGALIKITLGGDTTITSIGGAEDGTQLALELTQGASPWLVTFPASVVLSGPYSPSKAAAAVDTLFFVYTGSQWREVGRCLAEPHELRIKERKVADGDLPSGGSVDLIVGVDAPLQTFEGTLPGNFTVNLSTTGAKKGDRFELAFPDSPGLTTDVAKVFTVNADVAYNYSQAKTLKGKMLAYYTGTAWRIIFGGSVTYA